MQRTFTERRCRPRPNNVHPAAHTVIPYAHFAFRIQSVIEVLLRPRPKSIKTGNCGCLPPVAVSQLQRRLSTVLPVVLTLTTAAAGLVRGSGTRPSMAWDDVSSVPTLMPRGRAIDERHPLVLLQPRPHPLRGQLKSRCVARAHFQSWPALTHPPSLGAIDSPPP